MDADDCRSSWESEVSYFRYCRDQRGNLVPIDLARRNGRLVPRFPPSMIEPAVPGEEESDEFGDLVAEVTQNLTAVQSRTFLRLADGASILEIAKEENISRAAIYDRIKRMIRRNAYCAISAMYGVLKRHINQNL